MPGSGRGDAFRIESRDLSALARDIKSVDKRLLKDFRSELKKSAQAPLQQAKTNAAAFSQRIPGATSLSVRFPARGAVIELRTNAKKAPHARPLENNGRPGSFRHPVFGNRESWVSQPARPYFWPAVDRARDQVNRNVEAVMDGFAKQLTKD